MTATQSQHATRFWRRLDPERVECGVCPRRCRLREGERGFCFLRGNVGGAVVLHGYGRSTGFQVDPIEKKPLFHFLPGTAALSFGTVGCNLGCRFCQNWDISQSRDQDSLMVAARPEAIARRAKELGCASVAFTYNDPVTCHEYCVDTAIACRELGLHPVAVSAGYQNAEPRAEFYAHMDAANLDLKAFSESFYRRLCGAQLQPVLETLQYIRQETRTWLELTTLLIPGENDSPGELERLSQWIAGTLGAEVPLHFSAFHPAWKLLDVPPTPLATLLEARRIAMANGLRYVYVGNLGSPEGENTYCHQCGQLLIGRDRYALTGWNLAEQGACARCGALCPGVLGP
ncbi:MAG: AmmeMemoRadiSam system radical SAM enzyme [Holophaga sp.]|nr:AmmeMemoRadiSam system radical SAM enzyme [Holophaga sp.]